jgi:hypothetical protein
MQRSLGHIPLVFWLLPAALLFAGDTSWKSKQAAEWTADDARTILSDSPWAKPLLAGLTPRQNEDQRRDSGSMGQPRGVGYDGVGEKQVRPKLDLPTILTKTYTAHATEYLPVLVRWESALPIRVAELKAGEAGPPTLDGEGYRVAVYGIPGGNFKGDPQKLGEPLKGAAALKREGKPDVRPSRVEVFQEQNGLVIVYLFPLSAELTRKDTFIEFGAQIGRVVIRQTFDVGEMLFRGALEL